MALEHGQVGRSSAQSWVVNAQSSPVRFLPSRPRSPCRGPFQRWSRSELKSFRRFEVFIVAAPVVFCGAFVKLIAEGSSHPKVSESSHTPSPSGSAKQVPLHAPIASYAPTQSSTSSQMPSASASATQSPPHTPIASSWLPSQSQSPSGTSEHPHS